MMATMMVIKDSKNFLKKWITEEAMTVKIEAPNAAKVLDPPKVDGLYADRLPHLDAITCAMLAVGGGPLAHYVVAASEFVGQTACRLRPR